MRGDAHLRRLGEGLDRLDGRAIRTAMGHIHRGRPGKVADTLIAYVRDVHRFAHGHALFELRRGRSYAMSHPLDLVNLADDIDLADAYRDYLVDLAGVASADLSRQVNEALEEGHRSELTVNETADRLGDLLKGFGRGRLRTIVRTEGSRVTGKTRQDIADRAAQDGYGPSHLRWSAILDDRVTKSCTFAHNHVRAREDRDARLVLPAHYSCRSVEVFVYPEDFDAPYAADWTLWTPPEIDAFAEVRRLEFPSWA